MIMHTPLLTTAFGLLMAVTAIGADDAKQVAVIDIEIVFKNLDGPSLRALAFPIDLESARTNILRKMNEIDNQIVLTKDTGTVARLAHDMELQKAKWNTLLSCSSFSEPHAAIENYVSKTYSNAYAAVIKIQAGRPLPIIASQYCVTNITETVTRNLHTAPK